MANKKLDQMVDRFLGWTLPKNFSPDGGISFTPPAELYPDMKDPDVHWPVGTNLLNAQEAEEMLRFVLGEEEVDGDSSETENVEFKLCKLQRLVDHLTKENARQSEEIRELKQTQFRWFNNEECWIWQGDGSDHLESLACPVVISPKDLQALIGKEKPTPDSVGEYILLLDRLPGLKVTYSMEGRVGTVVNIDVSSYTEESTIRIEPDNISPSPTPAQLAVPPLHAVKPRSITAVWLPNVKRVIHSIRGFTRLAGSIDKADPGDFYQCVTDQMSTRQYGFIEVIETLTGEDEPTPVGVRYLDLQDGCVCDVGRATFIENFMLMAKKVR